MDNLKTLKAEIPSYREAVADTLDELENYVGSTFKDDAELIEAIKDGSDRLEDAIHEIADGRVNVHTYDRMKWLTENLSRADQENAIACGAKTAEEIASFCWYECERDDIQEHLEELRGLIEASEEAAL